MVLATLRFLATGSILQIIGDFCGFDNSTASRLLYRVTRSIAGLKKQFIKMSSNEADLNNIKEDFYQIARFPKCIGALDCSHIKIQSPGGNNAEIFRNRKGFFSFNVQVLCDSKLKVEDIVCRWPGSSHDSVIFNNSNLRAQLEANEFGDSLIIGDKGYPNRNYLITPLRDPITPEEHLFNESHIRTRNVVERCFGVLKKRFPVLALGIRLNVKKVEAIVVACAVLHNIACQFGEPEPDTDADVLTAISNQINVNLTETFNVTHFDRNNITRYNLINTYFRGLL